MNIDKLISALQEAKAKGCEQVELAIIQDRKDFRNKLKSGELGHKDLLIDMTQYNSLDFDQDYGDFGEIDQEAGPKTKIDRGALIIFASISDRETLDENLAEYSQKNKRG